MSAAIALSRRVLEGNAQHTDNYLRFLKAGCSQDPLDLLHDTGVDMARPATVEAALAHFAHLGEELDDLL